MPPDACHPSGQLTGHALRNAHLRERALLRARGAPPLARAIVSLRAETLGMTRLEFARRSGIGRGTLRDVELGIHSPTRRTLKRIVAYCQRCRVSPERLEELRRLYAGPGDTLEQWIARLELRAGSAAELARRVGISPVTLWEYRRGNFPLPRTLLHRLCEAVGEDPAPAEALWHQTERQRFLDRGYPEALAEFWVWCARAGYAEKHLPSLGLSTATVRRLRYLELPPWEDMAPAARALAQGDDELRALNALWNRDEQRQRKQQTDGFGPLLKELRQKQGVSRRELADLFEIGGKKPARIIKYIEEDGFYSAQAYPAGLTALLASVPSERERLLQRWRERREQFHRRHRPETRADLRLARELYGFELRDMEPILGYSSLEYQRIERGVIPLLESARARILQAIHQAGQGRVAGLLRQRTKRAAERTAWQAPASVCEVVALLARREGGLIPLIRVLKQAGLKGLWPGRLRAIARGEVVPPWHLLERIAAACGVEDLSEARDDWTQRYREKLQARCRSPLGVEVRLLIAEVAPTPRAFSAQLPVNYSVLVRELQRIDRDEPLKWFHLERILRAVGVTTGGTRWREIHALWSTADLRKKKPAAPSRNHERNGMVRSESSVH